MESKLISIVVFVAVYGLVATEVLNKAAAALLGVMVLLIVGVVDVHTAAGYIDAETIMLLMGMMAIVAVLRKSGFFSILSVRIAKLTGGAVCRFDASSAEALRDLLGAVAVYAAGGRPALEDMARRRGGDVKRIAHQVAGKD